MFLDKLVDGLKFEMADLLPKFLLPMSLVL